MAERKPPETDVPGDQASQEEVPEEKAPPGSAAEIPTTDAPAGEPPAEEPPAESPPVEEPPPEAPPPEAPPPAEEPPDEEPPAEVPPPEATAQEPPAASPEEPEGQEGEQAEEAAAEPAAPLTAPPREPGEAPEEEEEREAPVTYPLPFLKVLFSFRGRLHRKAFWLKGVLPVFVISFVVQGIISGLAAVVVGVSLLGGVGMGAPDDGWTPQGQFQQVGDVTVGRVGADTGPARIEVEVVARGDTPGISKTVVLGGRRLQVTAAKRAGEDEIAYDMDFQWENYPVGVEAPASALELALQGLAFAVALFFLWPWFAIAVKRYHDRDKSGWWSLIGLVPLIGQLWLLVVLGFLRGTDGENRFGPDPVAAEGGG